ncbi:MAG: hypothetical protein QOI90_912, partial [Mycobacterium sp.]|nr:hypothetical protein [Mycobacterium sp.]
LGIDEAALLGALTHGSAGSRALGNVARAGSTAKFISAVGEFLGKDIAVVRETVAELGTDLGVPGRRRERSHSAHRQVSKRLQRWAIHRFHPARVHTMDVTVTQPFVTLPALASAPRRMQ